MIKIIKILLLSLLNLNLNSKNEPVRLNKTKNTSIVTKFSINWKIVLIIVSWVLFVLVILLFSPGNDSAISYNTPLA